MAPSAVEMTFAEKQLAKYGWKKGMGLGKMNDGISEPIKVKTCKNNLGIGNDPKKHLSHWWDMAYNRAVNNIIVERSENGNIEVKSSSVCSITQEKPNAFNINVLYDDFQQAGTLKGVQFTSNGQCRADSGSSDSEGGSRRIIGAPPQGLLLDMTDAELLKLCGGGTAHKGARHGLRMGGKMKRLKAMEEADAARAAEQRQAQPGPANCLGSVDKKDVVADGKRKKSCNEDKKGENSVRQENCKEAEVPNKKRKKSKKENDNDCSQIETFVGTKITEHEIDREDSAIDLNSDEPTSKHLKKKRKRENAANIPLDAQKNSVKSAIVPKEIKKKKKYRHREEDDVDEEKESRQTLCDTSAECERKKKKKKKYKASEIINESEENINTKLKIKSRADKAGADMPPTLEVDPSSEKIRQKTKKCKTQIHVHHG